MMRPQCRCFIAGNARRIRWNGADRLTASASSHRSGGKFSTGEKCRTTALFTRMSIAPTRTCSSAMTASMAVRCDRSAATLTASTPNCARRRSLACAGSLRSCRTMLAPAPARLSATARPRPAVAPVTSAHLPFNIALHSLSATYPRISTPAHSSSTFAIEVKSEDAPYLALVMASICRTAAPQTIGTPMASASSTQSRTSL